MASIKSVAKTEAETLRNGIAWAIIYRIERSWYSTSIYLDLDTDKLQAQDVDELREIARKDPNAVILNSHYCGHLSEDMTQQEIVNSIRWNYEHRYNLLTDFLDDMSDIDEQSTEDAPKRATEFCPHYTSAVDWNKLEECVSDLREVLNGAPEGDKLFYTEWEVKTAARILHEFKGIRTSAARLLLQNCITALDQVSGIRLP